MLAVKPSFANIVYLVRLQLTKDIEFTQKQVLKQIWLMENYLWVHELLSMNRILGCLGNTRAVFRCLWKRPDPNLDTAEPPCRPQVGDSNPGPNIRLVWQTGNKGMGSLNRKSHCRST